MNKWNTYFLRNKRNKIPVESPNFWNGNLKRDLFMKIVFRWQMNINVEETNIIDGIVMDFIFT